MCNVLAELTGRYYPVEAVGYKDEPLSRVYDMNREEILWREYIRNLSSGDKEAVNEANRILRIIRKTPE